MQRLFAHLALLAASFFSLFPVLWVVAMALDPTSQARPTELKLWPAQISLGAFQQVLRHPVEVEGITFGQLLINSLLVAGATSLLAVLLGATAAYALARIPFPGRQWGLWGLLLLQMFPAVVSLPALYVLLSHLHLRTSLVGLAIAYSAGALPFAIWNLKGYFDTIPKDLEEAAQTDGCSPKGAFFRVVLPLCAPAMAVTALFGFMTGWTEIVLAWTLLEHPKTFTLSMALYALVGEYGTTRPWSEFAAMALLVSLPVVVVMLWLQRWIVAGLTAGAVKG